MQEMFTTAGSINSIASGCRFPSVPIATSTSPAPSIMCSFSSPSLHFYLNHRTVAVALKKAGDYDIQNKMKKKGLAGSSLLPVIRYGGAMNQGVTLATVEDSDIIPVFRNDGSTGMQSQSTFDVVLEGDREDCGGGGGARLIATSDKLAEFAYQRDATDRLGDVNGYSSSSSSPSPTATSLEDNGGGDNQNPNKQMDEAINATVLLAAGTFAITKLLTIDHDYWHGWTLLEILRYAPQHNWIAYEEALKKHPVLAKMMISGIVYSIGDCIAQCYEGKPILEFDRVRMFRSGLVGFSLHGSLSHYYYYFCEYLFPLDSWWVVPAKVVFDQTVWAALWNSIYFTILGLLRFETPSKIFGELTTTFWPLLTAGWKLWPFAHLITYGVVPVEQRLLWVDCVELVWVTILSTYSNEKSDSRNPEILPENDDTTF